MKFCAVCTKPLPPGPKSRRYCGSTCKMRRARNSLVGDAVPFQRTALNMATDVLYAACQGRHVLSEKAVRRDFGNEQRWVPVCDNCGVPIPRNVQGFNRKIGKEEAA